MPKVINIEPTPNPNALKFVLNGKILASGVRSFRDFVSAVGDPLGSGLFALGGVASVFYMDRFVTVNKEQDHEWTQLIDPICECIEEHEVQEGEAPVAPQPDLPPSEKLDRIMQVLDQRVRPGLAGDGGGLDVISFDGTTLQISYQGACGTCPSAGTGTLQFIEGLLRDEVDPNLRVISY